MTSGPTEHRNVTRVVEAAARAGLVIEPRSFTEGTRTAEDAAAAIGVDVGQIVKSLVFSVDGELVLALVSGSNRLDEAKLAEVAGGSGVERPEAERVKAETGFSIGGVPPFGHDRALRCFLDEDLFGYDLLWAAAGMPTVNFALTADDLERVTAGRRAALAR